MFFLFKQTTAYEVRISDWSSDVCSSDLLAAEDKPWTIGSLAAEALLAPQSGRDTTPHSVTQISERYDLAMRIFKGGEVEITAAEASLIQNAVAKNCAPIAAAQIIALTNGK